MKRLSSDQIKKARELFADLKKNGHDELSVIKAARDLLPKMAAAENVKFDAAAVEQALNDIFDWPANA